MHAKLTPDEWREFWETSLHRLQDIIDVYNEFRPIGFVLSGGFDFTTNTPTATGWVADLIARCEELGYWTRVRHENKDDGSYFYSVLEISRPGEPEGDVEHCYDFHGYQGQAVPYEKD